MNAQDREYSCRPPQKTAENIFQNLHGRGRLRKYWLQLLNHNMNIITNLSTICLPLILSRDLIYYVHVVCQSPDEWHEQYTAIQIAVNNQNILQRFVRARCLRCVDQKLVKSIINTHVHVRPDFFNSVDIKYSVPELH